MDPTWLKLISNIEIEGISQHNFTYSFEKLLMFQDGNTFLLKLNLFVTISNNSLLSFYFINSNISECNFYNSPSIITLKLNNYEKRTTE